MIMGPLDPHCHALPTYFSKFSCQTFPVISTDISFILSLLNEVWIEVLIK